MPWSIYIMYHLCIGRMSWEKKIIVIKRLSCYPRVYVSHVNYRQKNTQWGPSGLPKTYKREQGIRVLSPGLFRVTPIWSMMDLFIIILFLGTTHNGFCSYFLSPCTCLQSLNYLNLFSYLVHIIENSGIAQMDLYLYF